MYANPAHLRDHEVKVRFDEATMAAIEALAVVTRKQRAVLLRDLVMDEIHRRLAEESGKAAVVGRT